MKILDTTCLDRGQLALLAMIVGAADVPVEALGQRIVLSNLRRAEAAYHKRAGVGSFSPPLPTPAGIGHKE